MTDGADGSDTADVGRFIERFAELLLSAGMPRMPARVFAALMVDPDGSAAAVDLGERLRVSPAAVSGAVRYLAGVGMIERRRPLGSRRDEYRLADDDWYRLVLQRDALLGAWSTQMREGVTLFGRDSPAGRRMAVTAAFFDFLHEEVRGWGGRWETRRRDLGLGD